MRIGDLALATGVTPQTIRFYEREGLLPSVQREHNGYRQYDNQAASRLQFIRSAQAAGLTLTEISSIITLRQNGEVPCTHVSALLTDKLEGVRSRQRELDRLEAELLHLISASGELDPADCSAAAMCQIIPSPR
ncbi:MAG: heavy metal-responsive transcriptional regulator [Microbacteriaceae bacterium]|nr:MAG: heavy metal-responsive transcriptional regulator [Microbacteriaceae bacterium]